MGMMSIPYETVLVLSEIREQLHRINGSIEEVSSNIDTVGGSLRHQFAMAALNVVKNSYCIGEENRIAEQAFAIADAMMELL